MKTIYIVQYLDYRNINYVSEINLGAFISEEKAEKFCAAKNAELPEDKVNHFKYEIQEVNLLG